MFKKIIIIVLLAGLAGFAVYQFLKPSEEPEISAEPKEAVEKFYSDWLAYREEAPSRNPMRDRIYQARGDVTGRLVDKLDEVIDCCEESLSVYDPVLCAQDFPKSIDFEEIVRTAETAVIKVSEEFSGMTKELIVYLELFGGTWKIDDIDCLVKEDVITEEVSEQIAEVWINEVSPTYTFDGMNLVLENSSELDSADCRNCYRFVYNFESRQAGYGDRSGQMLAQVITPHTIEITIENGQIAKAIIDGVYDDLNQEMLENR